MNSDIVLPKHPWEQLSLMLLPAAGLALAMASAASFNSAFRSAAKQNLELLVVSLEQ
jgi:hypothetical protein